VTEEKSLPEILLEYALSEGGKDIGNLPGLWESTIDDRWVIKCNAHPEEVENIPPFSWYILYNGWPWGILHVQDGGLVGNGKEANEETLLAAIEGKMQTTLKNRQR
jgi:hypothetical protein